MLHAANVNYKGLFLDLFKKIILSTPVGNDIAGFSRNCGSIRPGD